MQCCRIQINREIDLIIFHLVFGTETLGNISTKHKWYISIMCSSAQPDPILPNKFLLWSKKNEDLLTLCSLRKAHNTFYIVCRYFWHEHFYSREERENIRHKTNVEFPALEIFRRSLVQQWYCAGRLTLIVLTLLCLSCATNPDNFTFHLKSGDTG